ncbi:MAG: hypothetical protein J5757_07770 [Lachnospiraceae bacterium]|nr:hypothetical protein [Lachnospiraceae bacterium]
MTMALLIITIISAVVMCIGEALAMTPGIVYAFGCAFASLFDGIDGTSVEYHGEGIMLVYAAVVMFCAALVFALGIAAYFPSRRRDVKSSIALYVSACVVAFIGLVFEILCYLFVMKYNDEICAPSIIILWPILQGLLLAAMVVMTVMTLREADLND